MHFHAEIWIPNKLKIGSSKLEKTIEDIMLPYYDGFNESEYDEDSVPPITFFDWYSIGGRWTGAHDKYDPYKDTANEQLCFICKGTGDRPEWVTYNINNERIFTDDWAKKCNGCNACHGTGVDFVHPSRFKPYKGDIIAVSDIPDDFDCYTLIVGSEVFMCEDIFAPVAEQEDGGFNGKVKEKLADLGVKSGYLVTVDYHN